MAGPTKPPSDARKNAETYFRKAEQGPTLAKKIRKKERADSSANTARLRELRLAKEAADDANKPESEKPKAERPARARSTRLRLTY